MMKELCNCGLIPERHPDCPYCGEVDRIIPIYYGLQNLDAIELERAGRLEWGSRFYKIGAPCWRCKHCEKSFGEA